jgi:hypothetical protein
MSTQNKRHCGGQHHFVADCRFHLATFIDDLLISTVGEYRQGRRDKQEEIGSGRFYETMVFRTDNDWNTKTVDDVGGKAERYQHPDVADYGEIHTEDAQTADEATRNHEATILAVEAGDIR